MVAKPTAKRPKGKKANFNLFAIAFLAANRRLGRVGPIVMEWQGWLPATGNFPKGVGREMALAFGTPNWPILPELTPRSERLGKHGPGQLLGRGAMFIVGEVDSKAKQTESIAS
jgi:hypothetical protein